MSDTAPKELDVDSYGSGFAAGLYVSMISMALYFNRKEGVELHEINDLMPKATKANMAEFEDMMASYSEDFMLDHANRCGELMKQTVREHLSTGKPVPPNPMDYRNF